MRKTIIVLILTILSLGSCNKTDNQKSIEKGLRDTQGHRWFSESDGSLIYDGETLTLTDAGDFPDDIEDILTGIKITEHYNYNEDRKSFFTSTSNTLRFLEGFSEEEIAENIEELYVKKMYDPADYDKIKDIYFIEEVKDLKFIKRFSQIKRLNLESDIIENIESLSYLKNIEELEINLKKIDGWDPMADFSPIGNLKTLKKLEIYGRKEITDISPIRNLVNLEELVIGGEIKINDMNPVFDLSSLKKLDLPFLNQPSPEQISKLVNLEYFESPVVLDNKLLNSLIKLKHLKNIKIWYVAAKDISPLLKLPGFKKMEKLLDLHETIHVCNIIYHKGYPPAGYIEDLDAGIKVLEQILQAGENPNEKKNAGYLYREDSGGIYFLEADITPLMQSRVPKITELLIKYGARVNDQDEYGRTALMISSYFDGISSNEYMNKINENIIAKLLIDNGADINKKNKTGQTALHFAVIGLNFASIKLLTEKGADLTIRDNNGLTPIMAASYFHYYGNYNKYEEITEILTKAGAVKNNDDINIINELKWENEYHNVDDGLNIEYGER